MSSKLPKHLVAMTGPELEALCVNCSACCHAQVALGKGLNVMVPELRCKHLRTKPDGESWCVVYNERHAVAKSWCFSLAEAIEKGLFPKQCPYVSGMGSYSGTKILPAEQYQRLRPLIRKSLIENEKPAWVADRLWAFFVFDA